MALSFTAFDKNTLEKSYRWLSDEEIKRLTMTPEITRESQRRWFDLLPSHKDYWIRTVEWEKTAIGVVGLKHIDYKNKKAEYFGYIGEKEMWGKGIGTGMLQYVLDYLNSIGIEYVYLHVANYNERAVCVYKKMGFQSIKRKGTVLKMMRKVGDPS